MTDAQRIAELEAEVAALKVLAIKALDDLDSEANARMSLENAQANFSNPQPEIKSYHLAMVTASKSSMALRLAARKEQS